MGAVPTAVEKQNMHELKTARQELAVAQAKLVSRDKALESQRLAHLKQMIKLKEAAMGFTEASDGEEGESEGDDDDEGAGAHVLGAHTRTPGAHVVGSDGELVGQMLQLRKPGLDGFHKDVGDIEDYTEVHLREHLSRPAQKPLSDRQKAKILSQRLHSAHGRIAQLSGANAGLAEARDAVEAERARLARKIELQDRLDMRSMRAQLGLLKQELELALCREQTLARAGEDDAVAVAHAREQEARVRGCVRALAAQTGAAAEEVERRVGRRLDKQQHALRRLDLRVLQLQAAADAVARRHDVAAAGAAEPEFFFNEYRGGGRKDKDGDREHLIVAAHAERLQLEKEQHRRKAVVDSIAAQMRKLRELQAQLRAPGRKAAVTSVARSDDSDLGGLRPTPLPSPRPDASDLESLRPTPLPSRPLSTASNASTSSARRRRVLRPK